MDSAYIPPHLDVSTTYIPSTHTHICLSVKPQATGTVLLKPLVTLGTHTHAHTPLAHRVAQSKSCPVSNYKSKNNAPIMSSKNNSTYTHYMNWPSVLAICSFNVKSRGVFLFCISHRLQLSRRTAGAVSELSAVTGLDMSVFPLMLVAVLCLSGASC